MTPAEVTKKFDVCVDAHLVQDPELRLFVKTHERKPLVIQNLCRQVALYETSKRFRLRPSSRHVNEMVAAVAVMFVDAVKRHRDQQNMSHSQRILLSHKDSLRNDVKHLIKEVPRGEERRLILPATRKGAGSAPHKDR